MGQGGSHSSSPRNDNMSAIFRSFHKKRSFRRKDLSATFHVLDVNMKHQNLLNINLASEEELMTLPGISRTIARNIVDYRLAIGGFKRVEDIALVSGIGANKLQQIRSEITTANRYQFVKKNDSSSCQTSLSEEQSLDSFFSGESGRYAKSSFKVRNVNTSNVFQLMSIQGISQELAANIVDYRERKGNFKNLDQLLKVKGMNYRILGAIRLYLTTESLNDNENDSGVLDMMVKQPIDMNEPYDQVTNGFSKSKCHRRSKSAPMRYPTYKDETSDADLFVLLSNRSKRPILHPTFDFMFDKRNAFRIATWHLDGLSEEKACNPGTKEVICRTILENGFGVVSLPDLLSLKSLEMILTELNKPTLPWVKQWPGHRGNWKAAVSQNASQFSMFCAFLYDSSQGIEHSGAVQKVSYSSFVCSKANFKIRELNVTFITVEKNGGDEMSNSQQPFDILNYDCDKIALIACGDGFQCDSENHNLKRICCSRDNLDRMHNNGKPHTHQQIYVGAYAEKLCTGRSGVITEGLSHLAIPQGWKWGGVVSHHSPTWIEMFTD